MIEHFVDEKINCFTEKVIPVKKIDIKFICADQKLHSHPSVEEALKNAIIEGVSCEYVNCKAI